MTPHAIIRAASRAATKGKIRCPNCGHLNESGAEKCAKCGYPLKGSEKKAGVIVGPVNASHSKQDLEDERASIRHLLESKKMWEGDRHTGRFTARGAGTFLGALGGTLGAFRGATLPADSSITGTRLGDALLAGAGSAVLGSSVGWAGAKYGLRNRMARVEAALAEKQQAEKKAEIEYRGHTFPGYNIPVRSSRPEKKKMVLAKKGDEVRLIHFGQQGYKHNYSDAAKKNYLARSAGIRGKGGLTKDDKFSANYWARRELWPKNEPADGTAKNREKRASSEKEDNFTHRAEILGLGAMMVPYAAHIGAKIPGIRRVAGPVSSFYHHNPTVEHVQELAALGTLMAPSIRHLMRARKQQSKEAEGDLLLGRLGRAVGNTFQKYPVPTLAAAYGVTKIPAIGKAWREGETDEAMPVGYAPALAAGSVVRHTTPETAAYLARRALGPV